MFIKMKNEINTDGACRFSVIVPCYNEEDGILETFQKLHRCLDDAGPHEVIVVNDGSTDNSGAVLAKMAEQEPTLRLVSHDRNRGYGAALKTGLRRARSELIVITDADGTYPVERIPELLEITETADMAVGIRTADDVEYPLIRKLPKVVLTRYASWMAGQRIPDLNSGLRVFRRSIALRFIPILPNGFSFTTTITLAMLTNHYDVRYLSIGYKARIGRSKIRPIRDTLNFCQLILRTAVYFAPMRAFAPMILILIALFAASVSYDVFVIRNLTDKTVILLMFVLNAGMFALLADMIDKRSGRQ
jgi:glycosyltransferase involved in cell wall biosynthesis